MHSQEKGIKIEIQALTQSLFSNDMIVYIENECTVQKKKIDLISTFSKILQKSKPRGMLMI